MRAQSLVRELKILHASGPKHQTIKQKQYGNKFSKDFKDVPYKKIFKKKNKGKAVVFNAKLNISCLLSFSMQDLPSLLYSLVEGQVSTHFVLT